MVSIDHFYTRSNGLPRKTCKTCWAQADANKRQTARNYVHVLKERAGSCNLCLIPYRREYAPCFDFDHMDQKTKSKTISHLVKQGTSTKRIDEEVEKCRLLCCMCHRIRTCQQLKYYSTVAFQTPEFQQSWQTPTQICQCLTLQYYS